MRLTLNLDLIINFLILIGQLIMYTRPKDGSLDMDYSPTLLVFFAECLKLTISITMYSRSNNMKDLPKLLLKEKKSFLL